MSYRYFNAPIRIELPPALLNALAEVRVPDRRIDNQVNGAAEKPLQSLQQSEVDIAVVPRRQGSELYQEVRIAGPLSLAAGNGRAKQVQPSNMEPDAKFLQFGGSLGDGRNCHFLSPELSASAPNWLLTFPLPTSCDSSR